jgi:hypothetical protein
VGQLVADMTRQIYKRVAVSSFAESRSVVHHNRTFQLASKARIVRCAPFLFCPPMPWVQTVMDRPSSRTGDWLPDRSVDGLTSSPRIVNPRFARGRRPDGLEGLEDGGRIVHHEDNPSARRPTTCPRSVAQDLVGSHHAATGRTES